MVELKKRIHDMLLVRDDCHKRTYLASVLPSANTEHFYFFFLHLVLVSYKNKFLKLLISV